uniref:hypothetical protein n=1 Tax=Mycobacterium avium TaxID=1764 RepID=UPI001F34473D
HFVHAVDTHTESEQLTDLENTGQLAALWWEDDDEWSTFTKVLVAAGHNYLSAYITPTCRRTPARRHVFRWTFDAPHADWVALGRPQRRGRGWAEFLIKWRMPEPARRAR